MSEEAALLQTIIDQPADDTARLVYADWLDERDDERSAARAEFIRGQCKLAGMREWDDGFAALNARCGLLLRSWSEHWSEPLMSLTAGAPDWMRSRFEFCRGFLDSAVIQPEQFTSQWEELFRRTPIRKVRMWHHDPDPPLEFWDCEGLARLDRLWIVRPNSCPSHPDRILRSAEWRLVDLGIPSDLTIDVPGTIADAPYAPNLERLELNSRESDPARWGPVWQSAAFRTLKYFGFRTRGDLSAHFDPAALVAAPWFTQLDQLAITGGGGYRGYRPLALSGLPALLERSRLRELSLGHMSLPARDASLFRTLAPVVLEHLDLCHARGLGNQLLSAILQSPGLANLRSLATGGNGSAVAHYLCDAPMRESLRTLRLFGCRAASVANFAAVGWPRLETLTVGTSANGCDADAATHAVDAILEPNNFPRLVSLTVQANHPHGLNLFRRLIENPAVARIKDLSLLLPLGAAERQLLLAAPAIRSLDRLCVPTHYLVPIVTTDRPEWVNEQAERKKAVTAMRVQFGPRYEPAGELEPW